MTSLNLALLCIGLLTLVLGLTAGLLKSRVYPLSAPMLATVVGILIGPAVLNWLDLLEWAPPERLLEQVARLTVAVAVMSIALRLPKGYFRRRARSMAVILSLGMFLMWAVSGLLTYALLGLPFWTALLVGAVVTPTDPVIAGTIVTGGTAESLIPARLRHSLSAESGANDGGAYPVVFLAILMIHYPPDQALTHWVVDKLLWEVLAAVAAGLLIGYVAGHVQRWSEARGYLEETSMLTVTVALSFTVLGAVKLMGSDGILAVFAAGIAFNNVAEQQDEAEEQNIQEAINRLFSFPIFVFFGMALPWAGWRNLGWAGIALAAAILLLRRLPMTFAVRSLMQPLQQRKDTWFYGWFGPIGVAAIYYATLAAHEVHDERIWIIGSLIVFASICVHGMTATPFTKWYGRNASQDQAGDAA